MRGGLFCIKGDFFMTTVSERESNYDVLRIFSAFALLSIMTSTNKMQWGFGKTFCTMGYAFAGYAIRLIIDRHGQSNLRAAVLLMFASFASMRIKRDLSWISLATYGIYLSHAFFVEFGRILYERQFGHDVAKDFSGVLFIPRQALLSFS